MKLLARLLVGVAIAGSFTVGTSPASACDTPPKCASCRLNPNFGTGDLRPFDCYN